MCKNCIGEMLQVAATIAVTEMEAHANIGDHEASLEYATLMSGLSCLRIMLNDQPNRFTALMKTVVTNNEDLINAEKGVEIDPNDCYWTDIAATLAGL